MLLKNKIDKLKTFLNSDGVLANLEERYCYAGDALNINVEKKIPDLVVFVETIEEVQKIVEYANLHKIPIISRGAGSNMVGACVCTTGGIVLNFSKMNKIIDINKSNMTITVQPGVVLSDLKTAVEQIGLFYPPDPSSYQVATIGGSIAQSSGGALSFKYGTTKDYVLSLKVVTADGSLIQVGSDTSKNSSGYHLAQLMVGSEGTLGIIVEATLKLIPKPENNTLIIAHFADFETAVKAVDKIIENQIYPSAIDFMDKNSIRTIEDFLPTGLNTDSECLLIVQIDGDKESIKYQTYKLEQIFKDLKSVDIKIPQTTQEIELIWRARRSSYSACTRLAPDVISEDIIVPRDRLLEIILKCNEIKQKYGLNICLIGHIGDGNLHPQFVLDLDDEDQYRAYTKAKSDLYSSVIKLGGSISAEHGIGIAKLPYLKDAIDIKTLEYMKLIKKAFDPNNILNPEKIFNL